MGKNQKCPFCGREFRRPEGYLTKVTGPNMPKDYIGKSAHVGCLEQFIISKNKTLEMLNRMSMSLD